MRLVVTLPFFSTRVGQAEYYLYKEMVRAGVEVHIVCSDQPYPSPLQKGSDFFPLGEEDVDGIVVHRLALKKRVGEWAFFGRDYLEMVLELAPDILHTHEFRYHASKLAVQAGKRLDVPVVLTQHVYHVPVTWYYRVPFRAWMATAGYDVLPSCSRFVALGPAQKAYLLEWGVSPELVSIIPSGVDSSLFKPGSSSKREKVLLYVGSYQDRKLGLFLPVLEKFLKERVDWKVVFVGKGELEEKVDTYARRNPDQVTNVGVLAREEVPELMARSMLFVQPSREEIFGLSALEAQACGLPVVATREGGLRTIVEEGVTGLLVEKAPMAVLAGLLKATKDPKVISSMSKSAVTRVKKHFLWSDISAHTLEVFNLAMVDK